MSYVTLLGAMHVFAYIYIYYQITCIILHINLTKLQREQEDCNDREWFLGAILTLLIIKY